MKSLREKNGSSSAANSPTAATRFRRRFARTGCRNLVTLDGEGLRRYEAASRLTQLAGQNTLPGAA
jgi:hypothetical protein